LNISATITDSGTSVDEAKVIIYNESGEYEPDIMKFMLRIGETDIYHYNASYNEIGHYAFVIQAWDTAGDTIEWQNMAESPEEEFRIIYEGVETNKPSIRAVNAYPKRQVIYGDVNISALINDTSGIESAHLIVLLGDGEYIYEMNKKVEGNIYYHVRDYDTPGDYSYYIEAIDASANKNKNDTSHIYRFFEIPTDYDMDDVPDKVEIEAGANPQNASDTINVSIGTEIGYLLWIESKAEYVYWNKGDNEVRDVNIKGNMFLFDSNDDGDYDYYYNEATGQITPYEEQVEEGIGDIIWIIPAIILFALVCLLFILIKRK
jgi:hypothetical protein